jgi:hypothetical protein
MTEADVATWTEAIPARQAMPGHPGGPAELPHAAGHA